MLCCENKIILTDVDDTILQFSEAFQNWAISKGYEIKSCIHNVGTVEDSLGISFNEAYPIIIDFLNSPEFGQIPPEPCAADVLPLLHKDGFRFVAITACEPSITTIALRHKNLSEAFGFEFDDVFISGFKTGIGKRPYLEKYKPTLWVEDSFAHSQLGADLGHNSALITRAINKSLHDPRILRVNTWHDIGNILIDKN